MLEYIRCVAATSGVIVALAMAAAGPAKAQSVEPARIEAAVEAVMPDVVLWRRDFHQNPELGFAEHRTAEVIADHLRGLGLEVRVGVGKTGLAVGYARRCVEDCHVEQLQFVTIPRLLSRLRSTYSNPDVTEDSVLQQYIQTRLLILDDMGAEQVKNTGWVEDRLYQIIGERHDELRPTIFTSNLSISKLAERIGERITWRIIEMCGRENIVEIKGANLRDRA